MAVDANRAVKPNRKLRKLLKKMPAVPTADEIHDFRTSSRRIEATLQAFSLDSKNNCRRILKVKQLRNILQMAENSDQQEFVKLLGEVKDAIGEWHDWEELVAMAREVLDRGTNCQLLHQLRRIADTKYRNALALSEAMRKKFLRMPEGGNKHTPQHHMRGPEESVWLATAALVA